MLWNKEQVIQRLEKKDWDKLFEIKEKREKTIRSLAQNKYYFWVIIDIISNHHWYSPAETHELLKATFNIETTTDLSTSEFKTLCEMIIDIWKTKFDCIIPLPRDIADEQSLFYSLWF